MTQLTCVLTRVELKHAWLTPLVWWHFRRVQRSIPDTDGLLRSVLLLESPHSLFFLSVWSNPRAILGLGEGSPHIPHVRAVRAAKRWSKGIWSTQWHLTRLSPTAEWWPGTGGGWRELARASGADHAHLPSFVWCSGSPVVGAPEAVRGGPTGGGYGQP